MSPRVSPPDWADQLTKNLAATIRAVREGQGMSAQGLADRTAALGCEMTRATIADLENGRRKYVTVAELMMLARALNTTPVSLLYPDPVSEEMIEFLPGLEASKIAALQWFSGEVGIPNPKVCDDPELYRDNVKPVAAARKIADLMEQQRLVLTVANAPSQVEKDTWPDIREATAIVSNLQKDIDALRLDYGR